MKKQKMVFQWETASNAAPFVSDFDRGFIGATDPESALKEIVKNYKHPCGLYAAEIREPSPKNPVLARYLSDRAATMEDAPCGSTEWKEGGLFVDGKKIPAKKERYELFKR